MNISYCVAIIVIVHLAFLFFLFGSAKKKFHQQIGIFWFFFGANSTNIAIFYFWKCLPIFLIKKLEKNNSCFAMYFFSWAPNKQCPPAGAPPQTHTHTHKCNKPLQQASLSMVD